MGIGQSVIDGAEDAIHYFGQKLHFGELKGDRFYIPVELEVFENGNYEEEFKTPEYFGVQIIDGVSENYLNISIATIGEGLTVYESFTNVTTNRSDNGNSTKERLGVSVCHPDHRNPTPICTPGDPSVDFIICKSASKYNRSKIDTVMYQSPNAPFSSDGLIYVSNFTEAVFDNTVFPFAHRNASGIPLIKNGPLRIMMGQKSWSDFVQGSFGFLGRSCRSPQLFSLILSNLNATDFILSIPKTNTDSKLEPGYMVLMDGSTSTYSDAIKFLDDSNNKINKINNNNEDKDKNFKQSGRSFRDFSWSETTARNISSTVDNLFAFPVYQLQVAVRAPLNSTNIIDGDISYSLFTSASVYWTALIDIQSDCLSLPPFLFGRFQKVANGTVTCPEGFIKKSKKGKNESEKKNISQRHRDNLNLCSVDSNASFIGNGYFSFSLDMPTGMNKNITKIIQVSLKSLLIQKENKKLICLTPSRTPASHDFDDMASTIYPPIIFGKSVIKNFLIAFSMSSAKVGFANRYPSESQGMVSSELNGQDRQLSLTRSYDNSEDVLFVNDGVSGMYRHNLMGDPKLQCSGHEVLLEDQQFCAVPDCEQFMYYSWNPVTKMCEFPRAETTISLLVTLIGFILGAACLNGVFKKRLIRKCFTAQSRRMAEI